MIPRRTRIQTSRAARIHLVAGAGTLCALAIFGVVHLPMPLHGDQALFQMGARRITEGGRMYVDFWDGKSPGIYLFHVLAGKLFGWREEGLRTLELLWQLGLASAIMHSTRRLRQPSWSGPFAALVVVGGYYASVDMWHLTQPAALLMFPMYLVGYFALLGRSGGRRQALWLFAAGLAGSVAMAFKEETVVAVVALLVLTTWRNASANRARQSKRIVRIGYAMLGLFVGIAAFTVWTASNEALKATIWTLFVFPVQARSYHGFIPIDRLFTSISWFWRSFWPICIVALGVVLTWQYPATRRITSLTVVACIAGFATIIFEPFAWWPFDTLLLLPSIGILATLVLSQAFMRVAALRRQPALIKVVIAGALIVPGLRSWQYKARQALPWLCQSETSEAFRMRVHSEHRDATNSAQFLRDPAAAAGPIYVIGNPNLARLGGREQVGRIHGWGWEILLPKQLEEMAESIQNHRPPYIYIGSEYERWLADALPEFTEWFRLEYPHRRNDPSGVWLGRHVVPARPDSSAQDS